VTDRQSKAAIRSPSFASRDAMCAFLATGSNSARVARVPQSLESEKRTLLVQYVNVVAERDLCRYRFGEPRVERRFGAQETNVPRRLRYARICRPRI
jgi:hypothetical protein